MDEIIRRVSGSMEITVYNKFLACCPFIVSFAEPENRLFLNAMT